MENVSNFPDDRRNSFKKVAESWDLIFLFSNSVQMEIIPKQPDQ
jgi:hypothetical protein